MNTKKKYILIILLPLMVLSCSEESEKIIDSQQNNSEIVKEKSLKLQEISIKNHWSLDKEENINKEIKSINSKLDDQEKKLLEADRKEMELDFQELIEEMDDNLANPDVREEVSGKMKLSTAEYKKKVLLLAKDKLKK